MEDVHVHAQDGREGRLDALGQGDAIDRADDIALVEPGPHRGHSGDVHFMGDGESLFHLGDLLFALERPLGHHRSDQLRGSVLPYLLRRRTQQPGQLGHGLGAIRGEIVNRPVLFPGVGDRLFQFGKRRGQEDTDVRCPVLELGQLSHPDHVFERDVITENRIAPGFDIDHRGETGRIQSEEVEE